MNDQYESLEALELELGLPKGFCWRLVAEDDWSFVIKLHALLESAVAGQITRAFERKELADIFARLEMSNTKTGKLAFIKALSLLPSGHIQFLRSLSELRNALVHNVQNVAVGLVEYFQLEAANWAPRDLKKLGNRWAFGIKVAGEEYQSEPLARFSLTIAVKEKLPVGVAFDRAHFFLAKPKESIWWTALAVLDAISLCNAYGPQIWSFLMECEERKDREDWVHELFARAKLDDPTLPEQMAQKFERLMPGVRVARDDDGQPILESLAAAMDRRRRKLLEEL